MGGVRIQDLASATSAVSTDIIEAEISGRSRKIALSVAFTGGKTAATFSATGVVELATDAETIAGTDTERVITPSNLTAKIDTDATLSNNLDTRIASQKAVKTYIDQALGSSWMDIAVAALEAYIESQLVISKKTVELPAFGFTTNVTVGDGAYYFIVPDQLDEFEIVRVAATVITAGTTNSTTIQINNVTDTVDILSTVMSIETTETSTRTSASPGVINTANNFVSKGDVLRIDIDAVSTTAPKGLIIELEFQRSIKALPN